MAKIARYRKGLHTIRAWERKLKQLSFEDNFNSVDVESFKSSIIYNGYTISTGSGGDYVVAPEPPLAGFEGGPIITILSNHTNEGAATLTFEGFPTYDIEFLEGLPLIGGELTEGSVFQVAFDEDRFTLLSYLPSFQSYTPTFSNLGGTSFTSVSFNASYRSHGKGFDLMIEASGTIGSNTLGYYASVPSGVSLDSFNSSVAAIRNNGTYTYGATVSRADATRLLVVPNGAVTQSAGTGAGFLFNATFIRTA